jgi:hypothetical protein
MRRNGVEAPLFDGSYGLPAGRRVGECRPRIVMDPS